MTQKVKRKETYCQQHQRIRTPRREHKYKAVDQVLIIMKLYERGKKDKISQLAEGPYKVLKAFNSRTLRIKRGQFDEIVQIKSLRPSYKRELSTCVCIFTPLKFWMPYMPVVHRSWGRMT